MKANFLTKLPRSIGRMPNLKGLDVTANKLSTNVDFPNVRKVRNSFQATSHAVARHEECSESLTRTNVGFPGHYTPPSVFDACNQFFDFAKGCDPNNETGGGSQRCRDICFWCKAYRPCQLTPKLEAGMSADQLATVVRNHLVPYLTSPPLFKEDAYSELESDAAQEKRKTLLSFIENVKVLADEKVLTEVAEKLSEYSVALSERVGERSSYDLGERLHFLTLHGAIPSSRSARRLKKVAQGSRTGEVSVLFSYFLHSVAAHQAASLAASTMMHHNYTNAKAIGELRTWYETWTPDVRGLPASTDDPAFPFSGFLPLGLRHLAFHRHYGMKLGTWEDVWGAFDTADLPHAERKLFFSTAMKHASGENADTDESKWMFDSKIPIEKQHRFRAFYVLLDELTNLIHQVACLPASAADGSSFLQMQIRESCSGPSQVPLGSSYL